LPVCAMKSACPVPVSSLAKNRSCHEKSRTARVYVIVRDGTAAHPPLTPDLVLFLQCVGLLGIALLATVVTRLWYLMTEGAKFWQDNWERHIDALEDSREGAIYKTYWVGADHPDDWKPYSVSKINARIVQVFFVFWCVLLIPPFIGVWRMAGLVFLGSSEKEIWIVMLLFLLFFILALPFAFRSIRMSSFASVSKKFPYPASHRLMTRNTLDLARENKRE